MSMAESGGRFSGPSATLAERRPPNLRTCRHRERRYEDNYLTATRRRAHQYQHYTQTSTMFSQATRSLLRAAPVARSPVSVCARTAFSTYSANSLISRMSQMSLARPVASPTKSLVAFHQTRGMKVRSSVKKLCDGCKVRTICSRERCWEPRYSQQEKGTIY
jgi:large subunit ribosomal protein L36